MDNYVHKFPKIWSICYFFKIIFRFYEFIILKRVRVSVYNCENFNFKSQNLTLFK